MSTELTPGVQEWFSHGKLVAYRGHKVFVRVGGSGPALLLIHGYPTASYDWHRIWSALSQLHTLIAVDMPGMGLSEKPADLAYSIKEHADLHEWLIAAMRLKRLSLMAHDLGVSVAQEMLARRMAGEPLAKVDAVVMLNGGLFPEAYQPRLILRMLSSPLGALIGPRMSRRAFGRTIKPLFGQNTQPGEALLDDFWGMVTHNQGLRVTHKVGRFWRERLALRDRLVEPLLKRAFPLLFINGTSDPNSGQHMVDRYRALVPDASVVCLDGTGHWPQLEEPEKVAAHAKKFLAAGAASEH
ncbi:MAG TPA: alpha/beta hydrolase [Polaromonas sp.]|uniref:alpha/beta fold hydrolase n=1 Tax=Polaromonas sp. TaxID=1869339 RepID=UPI002D6464EE|nr:alpha/beta hydrolase [Polaromonas sp.]HYW57950.1 alpha/beta hydrolase [Polaromonas sp.]